MADTFRVRSGTSLGWWGAAGKDRGWKGLGRGSLRGERLNKACVTSPVFLSTFPCSP